MKMIRKIYTILIVAVVALFFFTCEKDEDVPISAAQVDITEATTSYRNVQQQGSFVSNATITSAELHYTNDSAFADYKTLALSVGKDKSYTATIAPLQQGATYYVRYKVANSYSSMLLPRIDTLHTLAYTLPKVTTDSVGGITASLFVGYGTLVDWGYISLPKFGYKNELTVCHSDNEFAKENNIHTNTIENFWGLCKSRLFKFRGVNKNAFYTHLKECEFRYNNRDKNLYKMLLMRISS